MKTLFLAAAAALFLIAPQPARADVGAYAAQDAPVVRRYVEPDPWPTYREEVRVYRTVPTYETRVYRTVPRYETRVYREEPVYRDYDERPHRILPPGPHRIIGRMLFGD
jgi:hypothetical protein